MKEVRAPLQETIGVEKARRSPFSASWPACSPSWYALGGTESARSSHDRGTRARLDATLALSVAANAWSMAKRTELTPLFKEPSRRSSLLIAQLSLATS